MSCPGLHCPGCSGGQSLGVLAAVAVGLVVAAETVQWVAENIVWIGLTVAACFALAVAASMALEAWADRRGARFAALHGIRSRADVILPDPVRGVVVERLPEHPAIAPAPRVVINIFGMPSPEQAAIIRQALPLERPPDGHQGECSAPVTRPLLPSPHPREWMREQ
jgi:hypothetical protein